MVYSIAINMVVSFSMAFNASTCHNSTHRLVSKLSTLLLLTSRTVNSSHTVAFFLYSQNALVLLALTRHYQRIGFSFWLLTVDILLIAMYPFDWLRRSGMLSVELHLLLQYFVLAL